MYMENLVRSAIAPLTMVAVVAQNMVWKMKNAPAGGRLTAYFESPFEAEVSADAIFGMAKDYATVNMYFNGEKVVSEENLWHFEVDARTVPMGKVKLLKGKNTVTIEIAKPGDSRELGVVGLDRIIFYY